MTGGRGLRKRSMRDKNLAERLMSAIIVPVGFMCCGFLIAVVFLLHLYEKSELAAGASAVSEPVIENSNSGSAGVSLRALEVEVENLSLRLDRLENETPEEWLLRTEKRDD